VGWGVALVAMCLTKDGGSGYGDCVLGRADSGVLYLRLTETRGIEGECA